MIEGQEGVTWDQWRALAAAAERLGYEALFTSDHYGAGGIGSSDAWTVLAGLAARTERLRLGTLVSPVTFRHPTHLAKVATTVDRISAGRAEIGMGAGWWEEEHKAHGFPFPHTGDRFEMLAEQLEIVHGLLSDEQFSFEGRFYAVEDCTFAPKGVQRPHPPIIVGSKGLQRGIALAARWADEFNTWRGTPTETGERFARVREAVDEAGRDQSRFATSLMTWCFVGETEHDWRDRIERAHRLDPDARPFDEFLAKAEHDCIVGTPDRAAERLSEYAGAGAQRVMLNHSLFDDIEMLELLAEHVFPKVEG